MQFRSIEQRWNALDLDAHRRALLAPLPVARVRGVWKAECRVCVWAIWENDQTYAEQAHAQHLAEHGQALSALLGTAA